MARGWAAAAAFLVVSSSVAAQQVVDTTFSPRLRAAPSFPLGRGPAVTIDEAHHNLHTASGRYRPFVRLLEADGFVVRPGAARFDSASLAPVRVLVIANAVAERNMALGRLAVAGVLGVRAAMRSRRWWRGFVAVGRCCSSPIISRSPAPRTASRAHSACISRTASRCRRPGPDARTGDYPIVFRRDAGLVRHPIIDGRSAAERVDSVVSFTGSAFRLGSAAERPRELMRLPASTRVRLPVVAWQFSDSTPEIRGDGMLQGATLRFGRGRVAVFGEAAMFSAQIKGAERVPMGMNAPEARDNPQFVLNTLHWLVGLLPDR